jgi:hypothetical protein
VKPMIYEMDQITLSVQDPSEEAMPWLLVLHHIRACSATEIALVRIKQATSKDFKSFPSILRFHM